MLMAVMSGVFIFTSSARDDEIKTGLLFSCENVGSHCCQRERGHWESEGPQLSRSVTFREL